MIPFLQCAHVHTRAHTHTLYASVRRMAVDVFASSSLEYVCAPAVISTWYAQTRTHTHTATMLKASFLSHSWSCGCRLVTGGRQRRAATLAAAAAVEVVHGEHVPATNKKNPWTRMCHAFHYRC